MTGNSRNSNTNEKILRFIRRMKSDEMFRDRISLYFGATISAFFVITGLYSGIRYHSVWFTALAVYYAALTAVKVYIGLSYDKKGKSACCFKQNHWGDCWSADDVYYWVHHCEGFGWLEKGENVELMDTKKLFVGA